MGYWGSSFPGYNLDGRLDEVAIRSRALSDAEIGQLYNGGAGMAVPEPGAAALIVGLGLLGFVAYRRLAGSKIDR